MKALSVDLGHVRTGIAISDSRGTLASSLCVIEERDDDRLVEKICDIINEQKPQIVVVGLPKNMDGSEGESAQRARKLAEEITEKSSIPTHMQDERGTTITAHAFCPTPKCTARRERKKLTP